MPRTIDADALVYELTEMVRHNTGEYKYGIEAARLVAMESPTVATDTNVLGKWISVKDRLPEEKESMFAKFHDTEKWSRAMWLKESETVLVGVAFPDGGQKVTVGRLRDGKWSTTVSQVIPHIVTHWTPLPEPPKEEDDETD